MAYERITHYHEQAASREEAAMARASCAESARRHRALAAMHRDAAVMRDSVQATLRLAFGD